jgi:hypothetical protein
MTANIIINGRREKPDPDVPPAQQIDTFVLYFLNPTKYSEIALEAFGQTFPRHEFYATTERGAVLYVRDPIPEAITTFALRFKQ